jgi:hypothetical protein
VVAETPKIGGTLTYMIPADAPPSLDGHRETTYATVHTAAPFYSVLLRVNPENPSSTTDFVCDLCTTLPKPTDDGWTYIFKIREKRQVSRRVAADRRRCGRKLERNHPPARGRVERPRELLCDGRHGRGARPGEHVLDSEAHEMMMIWWYRIVPYRSYVKGWKISPSHYLNQDLSTIWLDN